MKLSKEQLGGLSLLLFSSVYCYLTLSIPLLPQFADVYNARSMPVALGVLGVLLSLALLTRRGSETGVERLHWVHGFVFLLLMSLYGLSLRPVGFILSTVLFLTAGFYVLGERRALAMMLVAGSVTAGFWLLMNFVLGVYIAPWPVGI